MTDPAAPVDVARLRRLLAEAGTSGWHLTRYAPDFETPGEPNFWILDGNHENVARCWDRSDTELVVAMHEALPELLTENAVLRNALSELRHWFPQNANSPPPLMNPAQPFLDMVDALLGVREP